MLSTFCDNIITPRMVKYWKILGDDKLNINTVYNISLCCILVVFFVTAYFLGIMIYASDAGIPDTEEKEISFTVAPARMDEQPTPIEPIPEPSETDACDYTGSDSYYDIPLIDQRQEYIFALCDEYDVPCELVLAIMGAESSYRDGQISPDGDYGIMQINEINHPYLAEKLGVTDFLDFEQNVLCGVYMLSDYYHRYTDFNKIAMCYRYGENGAKEMWDKEIYETDYTRQIVRAIATLAYR